MQDENAVLILEKGSEGSKTFALKAGVTLLGRGTGEPGKVCLDNPFISRSHAQVNCGDGRFVLRDLGSTNGTRLNGAAVEPTKDYPLADNDVIELARGAAMLRFRLARRTIVIDRDALEAAGLDRLTGAPLAVDEKARDVWVNGAKLQPPLSLRDFELLLVLYRRVEQACSKDDLATAWGDEAPSDEQIEQAIYRLRQRIEPDRASPCRILTIRGFGYKLTLPTQG